MRRGWRVFLLLLSMACWSDDERTDLAGVELVEEMSAHHAEAEAMRTALVRGDVEGVNEAATRLRKRLPLDALPADARYDELPLRDAVGRASSAPDLTSAASAAADVAAACGGCHAKRGVSFPQPTGERPDPALDGVRAAMARHHWAARRMWDGLLLPSQAAFVEAAEVLGPGDLAPAGSTVGSALPSLTVELEVRVHDLAAQAARMEDPAGRVRATAGILETCGVCHGAMGGGPPASGSGVDNGPPTPSPTTTAPGD
jgi:cytochrome c553